MHLSKPSALRIDVMLLHANKCILLHYTYTVLRIPLYDLGIRVYAQVIVPGTSIDTQRVI